MKFKKLRNKFIDKRIYGFRFEHYNTEIFFEDDKCRIKYLGTDEIDRWYLNRIEKSDSKREAFLLCKEYKLNKPNARFVWWGFPKIKQ